MLDIVLRRLLALFMLGNANFTGAIVDLADNANVAGMERNYGGQACWAVGISANGSNWEKHSGFWGTIIQD